MQPRTWPRPWAPAASIWIFFFPDPPASPLHLRAARRPNFARPHHPAIANPLLRRHSSFSSSPSRRSSYIGDLSSMPRPRQPFVAFLAYSATLLADGSKRAKRRRWRLRRRRRRYQHSRPSRTYDALWWVWRVPRFGIATGILGLDEDANSLSLSPWLHVILTSPPFSRAWILMQSFSTVSIHD